jgi:hypothetical protein
MVSRRQFADVHHHHLAGSRHSPAGRHKSDSAPRHGHRHELRVRPRRRSLKDLDVTHADRYLRRGDFSRWIADVFGDHELARGLQNHERKYVQSESRDALARIVAAIRSRRELTEESDAVVA